MNKKICSSCKSLLPDKYTNGFCPFCGAAFQMDDSARHNPDMPVAENSSEENRIFEKNASSSSVIEFEEVVSDAKHNDQQEQKTQIKQELEQNYEFCPFCGKKLQAVTSGEKLSFCPFCGNDLKIFNETREISVIKTGLPNGNTRNKRSILIAAASISIVVICVILCVVLLFSGVFGGKTTTESQKTSDKNTQTEAQSESQSEKNSQSQGSSDVVTFGKYEQDNNISNGAEGIEWLVIDKNEETGQTLLLSKYVLDAQPYNTKLEDVTWENSTLRKWLNEDTDGFYNTAFSDEEKAKIAVTPIQNPDTYGGYNKQLKTMMNSTGEGIVDLYFQVSGGNDTEDKVFLLNADEANRLLGDKYNGKKSFNPNMQVSGTAYATDQFLITNEDEKEEGEKVSCWWWLRSSGGYDYDDQGNGYVSYNNAVFIDYDGNFNDFDVDCEHAGVRPAMWVNMKQ